MRGQKDFIPSQIGFPVCLSNTKHTIKRKNDSKHHQDDLKYMKQRDTINETGGFGCRTHKRKDITIDSGQKIKDHADH
jgi:hypothetical protein